jgi:purine-nucleoside phosphorylase
LRGYDMSEYMKKLNIACEYIKMKLPDVPEIGMVLGSGLGDLAEEIENSITFDYKDIPEFPVSTVKGHEGKLIYGRLSGKRVLAMKGRFHYYEGYDMQTAAFGIRVMKKLGIGNVLITNAAGGINAGFSEGCLMIITDHIGFVGPSPLRGENIEDFGPRFPDMSEVYSKKLRGLAKVCAEEIGLPVEEGVYCYAQGPQYETPAEIRAMRILGADAVGMSTVPEAVAANHAGMKVLGISCITNMAAGMLDKPLSHKEVMETTERVRDQFMKYVKTIIGRLEV